MAASRDLPAPAATAEQAVEVAGPATVALTPANRHVPDGIEPASVDRQQPDRVAAARENRRVATELAAADLITKASKHPFLYAFVAVVLVNLLLVPVVIVVLGLQWGAVAGLGATTGTGIAMNRFTRKKTSPEYIKKDADA